MLEISDQEMGKLTTKDLFIMENRLLGKNSILMKSIQSHLTEIKTTVGETQKIAETAIQIGLTL